jgi:hypothetical protein
MRRPIALAVVVIALIMVAGPSLAHVVYTGDFPWNADNKCMKIQSEISHGHQLHFGNGGAGGYSRSDAWSMQHVRSLRKKRAACFRFRGTVPRARSERRSNCGGGTPLSAGTCAATRTRTTSPTPATTSRSRRTGRDRATAAGTDRGRRHHRLQLCSKHARFVNSGMHYLGPSTDAIPAARPEPPWVTNDGTVNIAAMPDLVAVGGGSGVKGYVRSADLMGVKRC